MSLLDTIVSKRCRKGERYVACRVAATTFLLMALRGYLTPAGWRVAIYRTLHNKNLSELCSAGQLNPGALE